MLVLSVKWRSVVCGLAVAALAVFLWWPLTRVFWFGSHEGVDYVSRVVEYQAALERGELYPRWSPSFYGGYGSPFFDFYAPLVYALGGVLGIVTGSPTLALKLVVLLGTLLAGLGTYALVLQETRRPDAALIAASVYLAAPYRIANVSWRGDLAEHFALGLLPLSLWAYRRIARAERIELLPARVLAATLAHAALVCTHTISGLWGMGFIAVLLVLSAVQLVRRRAFEHASVLPLAFIASLLTAAIYTLPALAEKGFVRTETMVLREVAPTRNLLAPSILLREGPHAMGPLLGLALGSCLLAWAVTRWRRRRAPLDASLWLLAALALVALTLPFAEPVWAAHVIPFGDYIQFPWRLLGPASLGAAVTLGLAWPRLAPARLSPLWLAVPIAAGILAAPSTQVAEVSGEQVLLSSERIKRAFIRGTSFDEYLPRAVTVTTRRIAYRLAHDTPQLDLQSAVSDGTRHRLQLDARAAGQLELSLHAFPGWQIETQQGPARVVLDTSDTGLVRLRVPKPGRYTLELRFGSTRVRDVALGLCLLGLLGAWPAAWLLCRRRRVRALDARGDVCIADDERLAA